MKETNDQTRQKSLETKLDQALYPDKAPRGWLETAISGLFITNIKLKTPDEKANKNIFQSKPFHPVLIFQKNLKMYVKYARRIMRI